METSEERKIAGRQRAYKHYLKVKDTDEYKLRKKKDSKKYYENHKEKCQEYGKNHAKQYYQLHKEELNKKRLENYHKNKNVQIEVQ